MVILPLTSKRFFLRIILILLIVCAEYIIRNKQLPHKLIIVRLATPDYSDYDDFIDVWNNQLLNYLLHQLSSNYQQL